MAIIAARSQGINEVSSFTDDICEAVSLVTKELKNISFANFATDGVSVETRNIMTVLFKFLDGKLNYAAEVGNKYNTKNYCYQYAGESNAATICICFYAYT